MNPIDHWRLYDDLTVDQAALLVFGHDPSKKTDVPEECSAVVDAIAKGLLKGTIDGVLKSFYSMEMEGVIDDPLDDKLDVHSSTVEVSSLKKWLTEHNYQSSFFFVKDESVPDYLDPNHPRYAPKLAASIAAWKAVGEPKGKSPKQALEDWLKKHAADYQLIDKNKVPTKQAIEECSKVANWQPRGGVPKTPGG